MKVNFLEMAGGGYKATGPGGHIEFVPGRYGAGSYLFDLYGEKGKGPDLNRLSKASLDWMFSETDALIIEALIYKDLTYNKTMAASQLGTLEGHPLGEAIPDDLDIRYWTIKSHLQAKGGYKKLPIIQMKRERIRNSVPTVLVTTGGESKALVNPATGLVENIISLADGIKEFDGMRVVGFDGPLEPGGYTWANGTNKFQPTPQLTKSLLKARQQRFDFNAERFA